MSQLSENICRVTFTKKNGDERVMICTTMSKYLPPRVEDFGELEEDNKPVKASNPDVQCVFDLEALAWRSYIIKNVISIDVLNGDDLKDLVATAAQHAANSLENLAEKV